MRKEAETLWSSCSFGLAGLSILFSFGLLDCPCQQGSTLRRHSGKTRTLGEEKSKVRVFEGSEMDTTGISPSFSFIFFPPD